MIQLWLLKNWKYLLLLITLVSGLAATYYGIASYHHKQGYKEAEGKYELVIKEYRTSIDKKVEDVKDLAFILSNSNDAFNTRLSRQIAEIKKSLDGKPLYYIKSDGTCSVSDDFIRAHNEAVRKVNAND